MTSTVQPSSSPRVDGVTTGRVLVVEQHALLAMGLQLALSACDWTVEAVSAATATDLMGRAEPFRPQCIIVGMNPTAAKTHSVEVIASLAAFGAPVLVLTAERRRSVLAECLEAGAAGWISTEASLDDVEAALRCVIAGGSLIGRADRAALLDELRCERAGSVRAQAWAGLLTQREAVVLAALVDGLSAEEIAETQYVALTTVRSQIRAVLRKLDVRSQVAAVAIAAPHRELLPQQPGTVPERRRPQPGGLAGGRTSGRHSAA
jgi:two-component system nitrate/nitrite response regulator NarL